MENIKLPLDLNLNPIGCLCPETSGTVEPGVDYTVEEPGGQCVVLCFQGQIFQRRYYSADTSCRSERHISGGGFGRGKLKGDVVSYR